MDPASDMTWRSHVSRAIGVPGYWTESLFERRAGVLLIDLNGLRTFFSDLDIMFAVVYQGI